MEQTHTFEELKKKTVGQLREIAKGIENDDVKGYTQLNKEHLLKAICTTLNIDLHEHHEVMGVNKTTIKNQIRLLKKKKQEAEKASNYSQLKVYRRQIHGLKRKLHKALV